MIESIVDSRRSFLRTVPVVGLLTADDLIARSSRISFQEASRNINKRQAYIDQVVKEVLEEIGLEMPFANVTYDHDRSKEAVVQRRNSMEVLSDPRYMSYLRRLISDDSEYFSRAMNYFTKVIKFNGPINAKQRQARIKNYVYSDNGIRQFATYLKTSANSQKDTAFAVTVNDASHIGSLGSADIFVRKELFEGKEEGLISRHSFEGVEVSIPPSEEVFKAAIRHELSHAFGMHYGIEIGEVTINNASYYDFHPEVVKFVHECRSWIDMIKYAKQFNRKSKNPHVKYHPAYLTALFGFNRERSYLAERIRGKIQQGAIDRDRSLPLFDHQNVINDKVVSDVDTVYREFILSDSKGRLR